MLGGQQTAGVGGLFNYLVHSRIQLGWIVDIIFQKSGEGFEMRQKDPIKPGQEVERSERLPAN